MKKIGLFLEAEPYGGGAFQYSHAVLDAVKALPKDAFSVVVAYSSVTWARLLNAYHGKKIFIEKGFWGASFDRPRFINPPIELWRRLCPFFHPVAKALLREHCDLWIFPSQNVWSYQIPVPALVSIFDLMHRYERQFPEVSEKLEYRFREWHFKNICRWAKGILVDSNIGKNHVSESYGVHEDRLFVLPYIAPRYIHSGSSSKNVHERYSLPVKYIFYPAQFWQHKNHAGLIKALFILKDAIPDLKLVLVGSKKNAFQSTIRLMHRLTVSDRVTILGYVPDEDMPELYRRARALIMPTFLGPTNIPPLEAFAAGCPVAVSGIYGIPDQVGNAALLFNPYSVEEIASCIKRLWRDDKLCQELIRNGKIKDKLWGQNQFNEKIRQILINILSFS